MPNSVWYYVEILLPFLGSAARVFILNKANGDLSVGGERRESRRPRSFGIYGPFR